MDDSETDAEMAAAALSERYTVITAHDALDAYALICQRRPDALLLDIMMPTLDGWTVLRKVRSNPTISAMPVVVLTGADLDGHDRQERFRGAASDRDKRRCYRAQSRDLRNGDWNIDSWCKIAHVYCTGSTRSSVTGVPGRNGRLLTSRHSGHLNHPGDR